jgi:hypothetical protein
MGLLFSILTLPYAPVRGLTALAKMLQRNGEEQLYGNASIRRELEALDEQLAAGQISPEEKSEAEQAIVDRLMVLQPIHAPATSTEEAEVNHAQDHSSPRRPR